MGSYRYHKRGRTKTRADSCVDEKRQIATFVSISSEKDSRAIMRTSISHATEGPQVRLTPERVCLVAGTGGLLIAFLLMVWREPLPFEGLVQRFAQMDSMSTSTDQWAE